MNYQKIYNSIISTARARTLLGNTYIEKHHIVPLSLEGKDTESNIVALTGKEHFIAHHLLWKIHRNREMAQAFMLMCNTKRDGIKYKVTAKEYQVLKEDNRKYRSEFMTDRAGNNLGKKLPQEWRDNISKSLIGNTRAVGNTSFKGKKHTDEAKRKISEKRKGVATRTGIPFSEDTKRVMSENRKGKPKQPWTDERKAARRELLARKRSQEKSPN